MIHLRGHLPKNRSFQFNCCIHHRIRSCKFLFVSSAWLTDYVEAGPESETQSSIVLTPNTGFTTYCDSEGVQVLSSVAELVTAHELGHSWGAPHDPDTAECTPSAENGGRFLMYTFAVPGYSPNNYVSCLLSHALPFLVLSGCLIWCVCSLFESLLHCIPRNNCCGDHLESRYLLTGLHMLCPARYILIRFKSLMQSFYNYPHSEMDVEVSKSGQMLRNGRQTSRISLFLFKNPKCLHSFV